VSADLRSGGGIDRACQSPHGEFITRRVALLPVACMVARNVKDGAMGLAELLVFAGQVWLWIGAAVAAVFLTIGLDRIDEDARGAYIFRPLLIPGVLLIWPLVLWRWLQIERAGDVTPKRYDAVRSAHGPATAAMSLVIVLVLIFGWTARQDWPSEIAPVQISEGASQ